MNKTNKRKEYDTIKQEIHNTRNNYEVKILNKITLIIDTKTQNEIKTKTETKWAKFTYVTRKTTFITKMLKNSNLNASFKVDNTI